MNLVDILIIAIIRRSRDHTRVVFQTPGGIVGSVKIPSDPAVHAGVTITAPFASLEPWPLP